MKPLLIGQAPGPNTNPKMPLWPLPKTSAGGRLAQFMGLDPEEYVDRFERVNLLYHFPGQTKRDDKWPVAKARIAAEAMLPLLTGRTILFIGRNVSNAFGWPANEVDFLQWTEHSEYGFRFAIVPHPSGRSRWYSFPDNKVQSDDFWFDFLMKEQKVVAFQPSPLHAL